MTPQSSLRALSRTQFTIAQGCLATAYTAEFLAALVGVIGCTVPSWGASSALVLAVLALVGTWVRGLSSRFADSAHDILRRLDLQDALGRPINPAIVADLIDDVPDLVQRLALRSQSAPYFGSVSQPGPRRLLENLRESSWWTKRLAGDMAKVTNGFTVVLTGVGMLTLLAAVNGIRGPGALQGASAWISAVILFAIAQGPHHASGRYGQLRDSAAAVQQRAEHLLGRSAPDEMDALQVAADYHLARQRAPVIPTLWYERRRPALNKLWDSVQGKVTLSTTREGA